ncbi:hypothetical protein [Coleofasciculus sp. G2-EDA-02]|jgi:hypothetical protein|uniref:hypothetical protein n=1 Tax=unclassified Coleofasciculus TaxID=2692782 RepID=UPI0032F22D4D
MTELYNKPKPRRGRLFPEYTIPPEELARRKANRIELGQRCRVIFERVRWELIEKYYNWFIAIEPDSGDYLIDPKLERLIEKGQERYASHDIKLTIFRLNETGTCGKI